MTLPLPIRSRTRPAMLIATLAVLTLALPGCHRAVHDDAAHGYVDPSWITAVDSCWPDVPKLGRGVPALSGDLSLPADFRSAFPSYAGLSNAQIAAALAVPMQTAPDPDISKLTHSQTPVLTRGQAALGTGPQGAVVAGTDGIAPPDALCSIQSGTPLGFK